MISRRLLSYIFPQTIARFSTKFNKDIRVNEEYGKPKLLVNGSRQSGAYIEKLWKEAFNSFGIRYIDAQRILVLGTGGGTVIQILRRIFPQAMIDAIDIDNVMLDIGKTYFGLSTVPRLTMYQDDAKHFVKRTKKKYDLIVIDLFIGRNIPGFVGTEEFLIDLKELLKKESAIVINYLREEEYGVLSDNLWVRLEKLFSKVDEFPIERNRFFKAEMC